MDNIERRDREMPYISDDAVFEEQKRTRKLGHLTVERNKNP